MHHLGYGCTETKIGAAAMLFDAFAPKKREQLDLRSDAVKCLRRRSVGDQLGEETRIEWHTGQIAQLFAPMGDRIVERRRLGAKLSELLIIPRRNGDMPNIGEFFGGVSRGRWWAVEQNAELLAHPQIERTYRGNHPPARGRAIEHGIDQRTKCAFASSPAGSIERVDKEKRGLLAR